MCVKSRRCSATGGHWCRRLYITDKHNQRVAYKYCYKNTVTTKRELENTESERRKGKSKEQSVLNHLAHTVYYRIF